MRKFTLLLLVSVLSTGCVAFFNFPANRFDTPEVQGGIGNAFVDLGGGGSQQVGVTPDYETVQADPDHPTLSAAAESRFALGVGLFERLDISFKWSFAEGRPYLFQLKYQLIGEPRTSASTDNFSVAVTGAIGGLKSSASDSSGGTGASDYSLSGTALDTALIIGKRISKTAMFYGGAFYTSANYSGDQFVNGGPRTNFSGRGYQGGVNLGLEVGFDAFRIKTEVAEVRAVSGESGRTGPFLGIVGTFYF